MKSRLVALLAIMEALALSACNPRAATTYTSTPEAAQVPVTPGPTTLATSTARASIDLTGASGAAVTSPTSTTAPLASPAVAPSRIAAPSPATAAKPASGQGIKVGSLHPLTGPLASIGAKMDHSVKQAVDVVNAQGGIKSLGGRPLEAVSGDTQSVAEVAPIEAQRLIGSGAVALVGTYPTAATLSVADLAERTPVPLIIDASAADKITQQGYRYTFRIQPNETIMGIYGARYLKEISTAAGQSITNIAYFHESSDFGVNVFAGFKGEAARQGMRITHEVSYDLSTTDLSAQTAKALSDNPQVVAVTGFLTDGVSLTKSLALMQPPAKAIWGVADGGFDLPDFVAAAQADGNYVFDANYHYNAASKTVQGLRSTYKQHSGEDMPTEAVFAYQAVLLVADALERAGSTDRSAVRDALAAANLPSDLIPMVGPIRFDIRGENINAAPIIEQVQQGQIYQVYPPEIAEKPFVFPGVPWN